MRSTARSPHRHSPTALVLATAALLLTATGALAAGAGTLDSSFGNNGVAINDLGSSTDTGESVALQTDGKVLLMGTAQLDAQNPFHRTPIILRLNGNGSVDTSFAFNGRLATETLNFRGARMALQADGKIVVGGSTGNDLAVARYNTYGALDLTFGTNGVGSVEIGSDSREACTDVAIQPDGKIVLAGYQEIGNYIHYVIARFNSNGTPDLGFNDRGFQIIMFPNNRYNYGQAVAFQSNGKIVMSGTMVTDYDPGDGPWLTLARFNADGSLDPTFGSAGLVTSKVAKFESSRSALALQPDGRILVAGTMLGTTHDLGVARFNTDGSLDASFGTTGIVKTDFGNNEDGYDLALQPDGRIVVVGKNLAATFTGFLLARYSSNGSVDTTFGVNGEVVSDFDGAAQSANGVAIQPDGKIVVGGSTGGNAAAARYNPGESAVTPVTVAFRSAGAYDGWILESSETSNTGGLKDRLSTTFYLGDDAKDKQYRSILSFNTTSLPDAAVITGAELSIKRQNVVGTDPFTTHGQLRALIRAGAFSGDRELQLGDFAAARSPNTTLDPFAPISFSWYKATLSSTNLAYVNKYGVTQFRLQFGKDDNDDLSADYMKFYSGNSDYANQPQLLITYYAP